MSERKNKKTENLEKEINNITKQNNLEKLELENFSSIRFKKDLLMQEKNNEIIFVEIKKPIVLKTCDKRTKKYQKFISKISQKEVFKGAER